LELREAGRPDPGPGPGLNRGEVLAARAGLAALAAAGLAPCALLYSSTRRIGWALLLAATLLPALGIPAAVLRRARRGGGGGGLRLFLGALYLSCALWTAEWSLLPDVEYYLRDALLSASAMLFLLGALLLAFPVLFPRERGERRAGGEERSGTAAGRGEMESPLLGEGTEGAASHTEERGGA